MLKFDHMVYDKETFQKLQLASFNYIIASI